jgi:hypothetical protein
VGGEEITMTETQTDTDAQDSRIAEIQKAMQEGSYWQTPTMQAEYLRLVAERAGRSTPPGAR